MLWNNGLNLFHQFRRKAHRKDEHSLRNWVRWTWESWEDLFDAKKFLVHLFMLSILFQRRIQGEFLVSKDLITLETTKDTTRVSSVDPRSLWVPFCFGFAEFFFKNCVKLWLFWRRFSEAEILQDFNSRVRRVGPLPVMVANWRSSLGSFQKTKQTCLSKSWWWRMHPRKRGWFRTTHVFFFHSWVFSWFKRLFILEDEKDLAAKIQFFFEPFFWAWTFGHFFWGAPFCSRAGAKPDATIILVGNKACWEGMFALARKSYGVLCFI